jgi:integrase
LKRGADSAPERVTCGELLDDWLAYQRTRCGVETVRVWEWTVEAKGSVRAFFGHLKVVALTSDLLREYRRKVVADGKTETTANRHLAILRMALNHGRKCTPPKVLLVPWFPMNKEDNARQGFLEDDQYPKLRDALPDYLRQLFVTAYFTGVRVGELLAWRWEQIDLAQGFVTLRAEETKSRHARAVPVLAGDMRKWLELALEQSNGCPQVFSREGKPIKDFRGAWKEACKAAEVPDLKFHDLRRTAVRNMRRAGVSQVVRMRITGHRTDSMERRYNIVDVDDIVSAKLSMEARIGSVASKASF